MQFAKDRLNDALEYENAGGGGRCCPVVVLPVSRQQDAQRCLLAKRLVSTVNVLPISKEAQPSRPRDRFRTATPVRPTTMVGRNASQSTVSGLSRSGAGGRPIADMVLWRTKLTVRDSISPIPASI